MSELDRKGSKTCIYWSSGCTANQYFTTSSISCYNEGNCDGYGTCIGCSRYDVPGLKLASRSKADVESSTSGHQVPANVTMYNLRAKIAKCCNWNGAPLDLSLDSSGKISPYMISASGTGGGTTATKCSLIPATDWQIPWHETSKNSTIFPCNGAKTSCPYYTGPKFQYITDESLEMGQRVSAPQIMELRYYSRDWSKEENPKTEYRKAFSKPDLWAWSGAFDDSTAGEAALPGVQKVSLFENGAAASFAEALSIGAVRYGHAGTQVEGQTPAYPTLIQELSSVITTLSIKWPAASASSPQVFRTFRIGQNKIYVIVVSSSIYPVYAVNMTKHSKAGRTDEEFVQYLLDYYPDDISVGDTSFGTIGVVFDVDLVYYPEVNHIQVFTHNPAATDGSMFTASTYVQHKFYHAHLAQTSFSDNYGNPSVEPWVDRFLDFSADVEIKQLSKNKAAADPDVLWDAVAYYYPTIIPTQFAASEVIADWVDISCGAVAITVSNPYINPVNPWTVVQGQQTAQNLANTTLGIWCDRSANPAVPASGQLVEMEVLSKSVGVYHPANVIFIKPKSGTLALDKNYDKFKITFAYTEYEQGPVSNVPIGDMKYPSLYNNYVKSMPYKVEMSESGEKFSVSGLKFPYYEEGALRGHLGISDFEATLVEIETLLSDNEKAAIASFASGGASESGIQQNSFAFSKVEGEFASRYSGMVFDGNVPVTLPNLCSLLNSAGYYEGTQEYRVLFSDETGRPIGIKRVALLLQSAYVSHRDVEIYYRWRTQSAFLDPRDHTSLLAMDYQPMKRSNVLLDSYYEPDCGDHSLQTAGQTFFSKVTHSDESLSWDTVTAGDLLAQAELGQNESGPLWYPYKACSTPRYHQEDPFTRSVLCNGYVEGFLTSKRRDYWEKMRGSDIYWTVKLGLQTFIGCTWSWVEGDYQTVKDPVFAGFTRIRSGHVLGNYQTDREAARLSRHYSKRNLSVRTEWIRTEGYNGSQTLSPEGSARLLSDQGSPVANEKPIWVHCFDDLSVVNRTTPLAKHPFSNVVMVSSADHPVNETFDATRRFLPDVMTQRHLIKRDTRDERGNLVYTPGEPIFEAGEDEESLLLSKGTDVFWIYKKGADAGLPDNISWAWLEIAKPPKRSSTRTISGVILYNPSVNGWKKNMESATFMPDGTYPLVYTPPTFSSTGAVTKNPSLSWAGGPPREFDWSTGNLLGAPSSYGKDPYDVANHSSSNGAVFQIFGKVTSVGNGFLADASGVHVFEKDSTKVETFRGVGIRPTIQTSLLPYTTIDATLFNAPVKRDLTTLSSTTAAKTYEISLRGLKGVESVKIKYSLGLDTSSGKTLSLPQVIVDGYLPSGAWVSNIAYFVAKAPTGAFVVDTQTAAVSGRFTKVRVRISNTATKTYNGLYDINVNIREPSARTELVTVYNQAVNISYGDSGRYSGDLLYYYGRTFADFGLKDVNYEEDVNKNGPYQQDLKWQGRTVKDILVQYHFTDPTGVVYDYPAAPVSAIDGISASAGTYYIDQALDIHTKGQTVVTSTHVDDPIDAQSSGLSWSNVVAKNEVSRCASAKSGTILDEGLEECLHEEAVDLLRSVTTVYESFWHPDEVAFFVGEVRLPEMPSWTLTVKSTVPSLPKIMRHQQYGCSARYTTELFDGKVHPIPPWRAMGHLLYLGRPVWNWSCTAVIMQKIGTHLGESLFEKNPEDYVASRTWPVDTYTNVKVEDPDFYLSNPAYWDNPATYVGGTMSVGIPTNISAALNYTPGGIPRPVLTEFQLASQTRSWPLPTGPTIAGYKK